jgi:hypothetical protein
MGISKELQFVTRWGGVFLSFIPQQHDGAVTPL